MEKLIANYGKRWTAKYETTAKLFKKVTIYDKGKKIISYKDERRWSKSIRESISFIKFKGVMFFSSGQKIIVLDYDKNQKLINIDNPPKKVTIVTFFKLNKDDFIEINEKGIVILNKKDDKYKKIILKGIEIIERIKEIKDVQKLNKKIIEENKDLSFLEIIKKTMKEKEKLFIEKNEFEENSKTVGIAMTGGLDSTYLLCKAIHNKYNIVLYNLVQHDYISELENLKDLIPSVLKEYPKGKIKIGGVFKYAHVTSNEKYTVSHGQMAYVTNLMNMVKGIDELWIGYTTEDFTKTEAISRAEVITLLNKINGRKTVSIDFPLISDHISKTDILTRLPIGILEHIQYCDQMYLGESKIPCGTCVSCSEMGQAVLGLHKSNKDKAKEIYIKKVLPKKIICKLTKEFIIENIDYLLSDVMESNSEPIITLLKNKNTKMEGYKNGLYLINEINLEDLLKIEEHNKIKEVQKTLVEENPEKIQVNIKK